MFKNLGNIVLKWWHRNNLEWQIKNGFAPRGRTVVESGGMGGGVIKGTTKLVARHLRDGVEIDRREVVNKKVTVSFCNDIVDNLIAEVAAFGDYKYHDSGEGVVAEDNTDIGLGSPCGIARQIGSQEEGATTYEYKSIGTITYDAGYAVTEHGLFNTLASTILLDRTVFGAINVISTDQIEFTFTIQFAPEA